MQRGLGCLVLSLEVGHAEPPGRSSAPCPGGPAVAQGGVSTWVVVLQQRALGYIMGKKEKIGSAETAGAWMNSGVSFLFSGCALQC